MWPESLSVSSSARSGDIRSQFSGGVTLGNYSKGATPVQLAMLAGVCLVGFLIVRKVMR